MNGNGLYSVKAPSPADQAAYEQRVREVGFLAASFEFITEHARRLAAGERVAVVEVPRVVDLDVEREARR